MISYQDEWLQKRQRNVLLSAIQSTTAAPTPTFTSDQLNARRKYEILKSQNRAAGETNQRLTKAQIWSRLNSVTVGDIARGRRVPYQEAYYDLSVPLVGFNEPMPAPLSCAMHVDGDIALYTYSDIMHFSKADVVVSQDMGVFVNETRRVEAGYIVIPKHLDSDRILLHLSVPMSLWFYYVHGGELTTADGVRISSVARNELKDTDKIVMSVASIRVLITFNGKQIAIPSPALTYELSSFIATNIKPNDNNYAVQHIGTVNINHLQLPRQANVVYGVSLEVDYSYSIPNAFDVFQTGVLVNAAMSQRSQSSCSEVLTRLQPTLALAAYADSSFKRIYDPVSYQSLAPPIRFIVKMLEDEEFTTLSGDALSYRQTRTCDVGVVSAPSRHRFGTSDIILSVPISLWFYYIVGTGVQLDTSEKITMSVEDVDVVMTYMDDEVTSNEYQFASRPILRGNFATLVATNIPRDDDDRNNYGIQYVGMVDIANVQIDNVPGRDYRLQLRVTYLNSLPRDKIGFFKTGVHVNPSSSATLSSSPTILFDAKNGATYRPGSFA
jgi:hypothetical protein